MARGAVAFAVVAGLALAMLAALAVLRLTPSEPSRISPEVGRRREMSWRQKKHLKIGEHFQQRRLQVTSGSRAEPLPMSIHTELTQHRWTGARHESDDVLFAELHQAELEHAPESTPSIYVVCAQLHDAKAARELVTLNAAREEKHWVLFSSTEANAVCWHVSMLKDKASDLAANHGDVITHVTLLSALHTLEPGLVELAASSGAVRIPRADGLPQGGAFKVSLYAAVHGSERRADRVLAELNSHQWGLAELHGTSKAMFNTGSRLTDVDAGRSALASELRGWAQAFATVDAGQCLTDTGAPRLQIRARPCEANRNVMVEIEGTSEDEVSQSCLAAVVAHIAGHSQVSAVQRLPKDLVLAKHLRVAASELPALASDAAVPAQPMNEDVRRWLGHGMDANMPGSESFPFKASGEGQIVQVSDTGLDDASCYFRANQTTMWLMNESSAAWPPAWAKIRRSTGNAPYTDHKRRKVIQYISNDIERQYSDQFNGHGTHVAGTVAGKVLNDSNAVALDYDETYFAENSCTNFYGDCESHAGSCATLFCPTCSYPGYCDKMCGLCPGPSKYDGVAPDAKLMIFDGADEDGDGQGVSFPYDLGTGMFNIAYENGAFISTGSWGGTTGSDYYSRNAYVDEWLHEHDKFLALFAAGNSGDDDGDKSIGNPANSKNSIAVGASRTALPVDEMAYFSSRGPTPDGRIKPDIIAPGYSIDSAAASGIHAFATCRVTSMAGTSMATPAVAGAVANMREVLMRPDLESFAPIYIEGEKYSEANPPPAVVLKALLVAASVKITHGHKQDGSDINLDDYYGLDAPDDPNNDFQASYPLGGAFPDFHQGFGATVPGIVLYKSRTSIYTPEFFGYDEFSKDFVVVPPTTESVENISIALVWNDPPSVVYCAHCLVHDLDLMVEARGIGMSGNDMRVPFYPNFDRSAAASEGDHVNNVERVIIPHELLMDTFTSEVTIHVTARFNSTTLYGDSQSAALVVFGNLVEETAPETTRPSSEPSQMPTSFPTAQPSLMPASYPTAQPNLVPASYPTAQPNLMPASYPTAQPNLMPASYPTAQPNLVPTLPEREVCDPAIPTCARGFECMCSKEGRMDHSRKILFGAVDRCFCTPMPANQVHA